LCTVLSMPERPLRKLAVLAVGLALPAVAFGGQVKGKLVGLEKLMNPVWHEAKDVGSHRFSWREPSPTSIRTAISRVARAAAPLSWAGRPLAKAGRREVSNDWWKTCWIARDGWGSLTRS